MGLWVQLLWVQLGRPERMWEKLPLYICLVGMAARALGDPCAGIPPSPPSGLVCTEPPQLQPSDVIIAVVLIFLSGLFSGLNLGLMSLADEDLRIIIEGSNSATDIRYAQRIRPLRRHGNLLLCTLLLGNTLVNAVLTIQLDMISETLFGPGPIGVVATTFFIVVFGEIIPQSVCSRHGLLVGAYSVPIVYCFLVLTAPVAWPIAKLLDYLLGREISSVLSRTMLLELININLEETHKGSGLTSEDGKLLKGALTFKDRSVGDVMTPLPNCYFLSEDTLLDAQTIMDILSHGHTRIPVTRTGSADDVYAVLFCKDLLGIGFERNARLKDVLDTFGATQRVVRVSRAMKLNETMDICKQTRQHLVLVCSEADFAKSAGEGAPVIGLATMEDLIEELIQDEIIDYDDAWHYDRQTAPAPAPNGAAAKQRHVTKKVAVKNASQRFDATAHLKKLAPTLAVDMSTTGKPRSEMEA